MTEINGVINLESFKDNCKHCHSSKFCLSKNLKNKDLESFNTLIKRRKPLHRGERLFQGGDRFHAIYIIHSGSVKTYIESIDGEQQITGFYFTGDIVGIDGFENGLHSCSVESLETSSFCEIRLKTFDNIMSKIPLVQKQFFKYIIHEISREQQLILLLGRMNSKKGWLLFWSICPSNLNHKDVHQIKSL